jgi:hypothetical protein
MLLPGGHHDGQRLLVHAEQGLVIHLLMARVHGQCTPGAPPQ